jgi:hypothetical protein
MAIILILATHGLDFILNGGFKKDDIKDQTSLKVTGKRVIELPHMACVGNNVKYEVTGILQSNQEFVAYSKKLYDNVVVGETYKAVINGYDIKIIGD